MISSALLLTLLAADAAPRRFVFAVGENQGAQRDEKLLYAAEDARRVSEVLRELGGVRAEDVVVIDHADATELRKQFAAFARKLAAEASSGDQLIVYVSSHAAAGELRLRDTYFPMSELEAFVKQAPVEVKLLIID